MAWTYNASHSRIGFVVSHFGLTFVHGHFRDADVKLDINEDEPSKSSLEVTINAASMTTDFERRDDAVKGEHYLETDQYPTITFKSTRVERKGKDAFVLYGDLTLKGVTKPVQLPFKLAGAVKDPWGNTRFGVEAQTKINRRDFGINYGNAFAGGLDVGNEVTIDLQLEAVKAAPKPAGE